MAHEERTTGDVSALATIPQFCEREPAFTIGGIRHLLFTKGNEVEAAGAVVRFGRKLLIDPPRFLEYVRSGGARVIAGRRAA